MTHRRICAAILAICTLLAIGTTAAAEPVWSAQWIGAPWSTVRDGAELDSSQPLPIFRHAFDVHSDLASAELRIAGLGQFEAQLASGNTVGLVGAPGLHQSWTDYGKTVTFERYDVTSLVKVGRCVLSVMLGNGMYNVQRTKGRYTKLEASFGAPKLIAELRLTYSGGRTEVIGSDGTWKTIRGPVLFSSTFGGEDVDARKEPLHWRDAGFDDRSWDAAVTVAGPGGRLVPALAPEVVAAERYEAVTIRQAGDKQVYDLGQNFAGVPQLRLHGPAGAVLRLTPGELLRPNGEVSQASSGAPMWWTYTLAGTPDGEQWEPRFGFYGFRYVQAEWVGAADAPRGIVDRITGVAWHSRSSPAGTFESSDSTLNAIHKLIVEAMHNNQMSIFTDCPHREKLGWLEETHLVAAGMIFNNDLRGLYAATSRNMADAQRDNGDIPTTAPHYTQFGTIGSRFDDSPEWGSAAILAPWTAYRFYGDRQQLELSYPVMQRYLAYLEGKAVDGIVSYGLGDWYDIGPGNPGNSKLTSAGVTGTLMLYEDATAMQKIATILGRNGDVAGYARIAAKAESAFNQRFLDPAKGFYDKGSQTAQAIPLALGIVPGSAREGVLRRLVDDIGAHSDHVTTGEVGLPYLLRVLTENGRSDLLLAILRRTDPPSYGAQIRAGATALTEAWDGDPRSSQDHLMLGAAEEWFYRGLGGIDIDRSRANAAERLTIRPSLVTGLDHVKVTYRSIDGMVEVEWRQLAGGGVEVKTRVPGPATVVVGGVRQVVGAGEHRVVVSSATGEKLGR